MGALIQLFKDLFLSATTAFIIFWFLYDYQKGIYWYLFFYAIIALIGFNRVTYFENVIIPVFVFIGILIKSSKTLKPNTTYLIFFWYLVLVTYINNLTVIDTSSEGIYLFVIILIFSEYLFKEENQVTGIVFLVWLITIGFAINSLMFGEKLFSISNIDPEERALILNNGLVGSSSNNAGIDLNYFGCAQAIGALITILFIYYRNYLLSDVALPLELKRIIKSTLFPYLLYLLLGLEVWLVLRGVSRGALLVLLAGIVTFLLTLKKFKYIFFGCLLLLILYLITSRLGIIDLFTERIEDDPSGTSGRNLIWMAILGAVYHQGGIIQIIFGGGIGWPWWTFWTGNFWDRGVVPSTHNQWLSLYVNVGLVGLVLFLIPIVKGIKCNIKNNNPINNIRIVLFSCVFFESLSLEPLQFDRYVWFLLALITTYTPNTEKIYS